ncbi:MEDS domain-containing protein [Streptomyces tateyamensis]|uniref:MEDS domain-containing protein n=1 Tax=Streptomyces tateyamensis TaxID=565073 RepID=UPI0015E8C155|nr:MEDS domain-containing protein [Streptomyces tateyamensis]
MTRRTQGQPQPPSRLGEHLCRTYADDQERAQQVSALVRDGLARGQRVLYYADTQPTERVADQLRAEVAEAGAALERGQLSVESTADGFLRRLPFDPDLMIARLRDSCQEAVSQGWAGLRVIGEMDWSTRQVPGADRLLEYELRLDAEVLEDLPVTGICLYSHHAVTRAPAALAAAAHLDGADPADSAVTRYAAGGTQRARAGLAALPLRPGSGVRLVGSADLDSRTALAAVLTAATRMPASVVDVDLRDVDYVDAAGTAVLADTAAVLAGQGRRLVLHHAPPSLGRVAEMFPDECRDLEMTA